MMTREEAARGKLREAGLSSPTLYHPSPTLSEGSRTASFDDSDLSTSETTSMLPLSNTATPSPSSSRRPYFEVLGKTGFVPGWEGLRGIAVGLTMIAHVVPWKNSLGVLGVEIFFVLSGFLITGVLMGQLEKQNAVRLSSATTTRQAWWKRFAFLPRFYMDRFVRLTPALTIMLAGGSYLASIAHQPRIAEEAAASFFYMHNFLPKGGNGRNVWEGTFHNTWSLAVEEQFYIFWSLLIPFVLPLSPSKRAMVLVPLMAASFWVRMYSGWYFQHPTTFFGIYIDYHYAYSANAWKMFVGCSARLLPLPRFFTNKWVGLVAMALLFVDIGVQGWSLEPGRTFDFRNNGWLTELVTAPLVLVTLMGAINGNPILESKFFRYQGRISYSWYLWQYPLHKLAHWHGYDWGPTGQAFAIATFTTFLVEEPLRNKYHDWKKRRDSPPPAAKVLAHEHSDFEKPSTAV